MNSENKNPEKSERRSGSRGPRDEREPQSAERTESPREGIPLGKCFIDTHAHLDLATADFRSGATIIPDADRDISEILKRAADAGVTKILTISSSIEAARAAVKIAERNENVWASVGVHPDDIADFSEEILAELRTLASSSKVVAIGEIGFDFGPHGEKQSLEKQEKAFRDQLSLARELNLPAIIHTREADEHTLRVLQDFADLPLVVHCYQSGEKITDAILANENWKMSFTGLVTFGDKKIPKIIDAIERAPLEKIMLETDSPFLAPAPHRGETNEPAFVRFVAEKIAEVKNISIEEVAATTTATAEKFFGI